MIVINKINERIYNYFILRWQIQRNLKRNHRSRPNYFKINKRNTNKQENKTKIEQRGQPRFWGEEILEGSARDLKGRENRGLRDMRRLGFWFYSVDCRIYICRRGWSFEEKNKSQRRHSNDYWWKRRDTRFSREALGLVLGRINHN